MHILPNVLTTQTYGHVFVLQAVEEEKTVYERSSSKPIYLNLAVHLLHRLRQETAATGAVATLSPTKNPKSLSHEAVLGGQKASLTSFTVNRGGKQQSPPSSFSGTLSQDVSTAVLVHVL